MSRVITLLAPITERSPIGHAARDHHVGPAPDVVADHGRALAREALPGHGADRIVEAVVAVGDEAAVGEHAVVADLDVLDRGHHHADVEERLRADDDASRIRRGQPDVRLEQRVLSHLEAALPERLEHVAVQRPAREGLPPGQLPVNPRTVPGQRVALVPAPLLPPQAGVAHGGSLAERAAATQARAAGGRLVGRRWERWRRRARSAV